MAHLGTGTGTDYPASLDAHTRWRPPLHWWQRLRIWGRVPGSRMAEPQRSTDSAVLADALPPHPLTADLDRLWTRTQALQAFLAAVDPQPDDVIYGYPGLLRRAHRVLTRLIADSEGDSRNHA
jgi:hypothetical protein